MPPVLAVIVKCGDVCCLDVERIPFRCWSENCVCSLHLADFLSPIPLAMAQGVSSAMPLCYKARTPITPWSLPVPPVSCGEQWEQFSEAFTHSTLPSNYIQNPIAWNSVSGSLLSVTSAFHASWTKRLYRHL